MLQDTSARVTTLRERSLASTSVTQAIAGCFVEIDRYLAEYLWSSQMQSQRDIREVLVILQREREDRQNLLMTIESLVTRGQTATRGCVTLIDATGHQHPIPMDFCTSFEQFTEMLKVLFKCNSVEAQIQRRYTENGQYDLAIDEGTQVTRLTSNEWSRLEVGTKVVMRIIIQQQTTSYSEVSYRCPCGAVNTLGAEWVIYSLERQAGSSIDCQKCKRRFQISHVPSNPDRVARFSDMDSDHTTDTEMDLLRNFHVQQIESYACPPWLITAMGLIQETFPGDEFEAILRRPNPRAIPEWRMKCLDCPGKLYNCGPGDTLDNYKIHCRNRYHRLRVKDRLARSSSGRIAT